ncbi:5-hydroxytryptamine receptor 1 [Melipona quadrifasciata]|uniref:5-hydroxytryptamine receptor 1 n=1 Tax=Melipona quadrifasciata TaxID=166423 RepID=A0A0M9A346_9HYME|nr:5-hydroxytryptamine receptor 1 [Melipona quadrifasciata]
MDHQNDDSRNVICIRDDAGYQFSQTARSSSTPIFSGVHDPAVKTYTAQSNEAQINSSKHQKCKVLQILWTSASGRKVSHISITSVPAKFNKASTLVLQCSGHAVRCFAGGPRKSNESQCPMLQKLEKPVLTSSTTTTPPMTSTKSMNSTCSVTNSPHQKKLRFHLAKERKASTTLGIIMSAFIVCWLPFFVLALVRPFLKDPDAIPAFLSSLFLWLGYCNSLLNPIIYATLNRDFRKPFREILYFRCSNLNHMMREEFYQSQYGDPINNCEIKTGEMDDVERLNNQGIEAIDQQEVREERSTLSSKAFKRREARRESGKMKPKLRTAEVGKIESHNNNTRPERS